MSETHDFRPLIAARRDGAVQSAEDFRWLARAATDGTATDDQLAAWLMAAVLQPLTVGETADLTQALADSGERLDLSGLPGPHLDKHSTGGVGDKTTLVALPLLAACGVSVAKMSGRGLGITGGTVDKLGSIPGFRTDLSPEEMVAQARRIGIALTGQTPRLAPADGKLYALRDATATVESVPLIVASILSKKLAGGAEVVVLDVKAGVGSFMTTESRAVALAQALRATAEACGLRARCLVTDMDQPLGCTIGNALEVSEAAAVLRGEAPGPVADLAVELVTLALVTAGLASDPDAGRQTARDRLASGKALRVAERWLEAQGADPGVLHDGRGLPQAPERATVTYDGPDGWAEAVHAGRLGELAVALGAGRKRKSDPIDPAVGLEVMVRVGDRLAHGDPIGVVHAARPADLEGAIDDFRRAVTVRDTPVTRLSTVRQTI